jgi:superfamily II DNA or RNA helicase
MYQLDMFGEPRSFVYTASVQPRDYQSVGIDKAFALWERRCLGCIFRQPTGSGKTVSGALIAMRWLGLGDDRRVIVIAHERQLVGQFAEEIEGILGIVPGVEMGQEHKIDCRNVPLITVASRATLYEKDTGDGVKASRLYKFDNQRFKWIVIIDECHRWAYKLKSCRHILDWFEANPESRRLGLTATPERGDKTSLARLFPEVASDYRLYDIDGGPCAVRDGWAVAYDQRFVTVEAIDFKNLREISGDFDEGELSTILMERENLLKLIRPTLDIVGEKRTIIFNPTVAMAKAVAQTINGELGDAMCAVSLDGSVPDDERKSVYQRHQSGAFQFLSVCGLCREGYNDPGIQAVAVYRPTKSRSLAEQMKGRGCRPLRGVVDGLDSPEERLAAIAASDKPTCIIVDLVGVTGMADCASTAHILAEGKPDEVIERANKNAVKKDGPVDMADEIRNAERELDDERREREYREAQRKARIEAEVRYQQQQVPQGRGGNVSSSSGRGARMPFGKHKGKLVADVDTGYLNWLASSDKPPKGWLGEAVKREIAKRRAAKESPVPASPPSKQRPSIDDVNRMLFESVQDE